MRKRIKSITFFMALLVFAMGSSLLLSRSMVTIHAEDPEPTPAPSVVTISISQQSGASYQIDVPINVSPAPLSSDYGLGYRTYYYNVGTQVSLTAINPTPSPGLVYDVVTFLRWEGAVNSSSKIITIDMDSSKSLIAHYNVTRYGATPTPTPTPTGPQGTFVVSGYVYGNGGAMQGVAVYSSSANKYYTDGGGHYSFTVTYYTTRPTSVTLYAEKYGFITQINTFYVPPTGDVTATFNLALAPTPTINPVITVSGEIYDSITKEWIVGATVNMEPETTTSNEVGFYSVSHLYLTRPESITVTVSAPGYQTQSKSYLIGYSGGAVIHFYLVKLGGATPTPLVTPTPPSTIYFFFIKGTVYDDNTGLPISGAKVTGPNPNSNYTTDATGYYEIVVTFTGSTLPTVVPLHTQATGYQTLISEVREIPSIGHKVYNVYLIPVATPTVTTTITPTPTWRPTPSPLADGHAWEVITGNATNISATGATIDGEIVKHVIGTDVGGSAIVMALQYWEETDPGNKITADTLDSNSGQTTLTITINGLNSDTVYMYQAIKASGYSWYSDGDIKSFRTLAFTGTPTPTPVPGSIKAQFYNQSTAGTSNQIYTNIKLINTGTSAIVLSTVKIRYYYTIDGAKPQSFWCDYSPIGGSNVTGTFVAMETVKTGADTYLEIGFTSGAGSLAAGANVTIQGRIAKSDWSNYTQTNDYSFNTSDTTYVDWTKVTGYVSDALNWGVEP